MSLPRIWLIYTSRNKEKMHGTVISDKLREADINLIRKSLLIQDTYLYYISNSGKDPRRQY